MGWLLLLFIAVPIAELLLLVEIGRHIGLAATLAMILFTGALGATLARYQGLAVLRQFQAETAAGKLPTGAIFDGVLILLAGAVLLTPGILTDLFGFLCLVPPVRGFLKRTLRRRFENRAPGGRVHVSVDSHRPIRDVTPRDPEPAKRNLPLS